MHVKRKPNSNFIVAPDQASLDDIDFDLLAADVKYILVESNGKPFKLFSLASMLQRCLKNENLQERFNDIKEELPFAFLEEGHSLVELDELQTDYVLQLDGQNDITEVIDNVREKQKWVLFEEIIENFQEEIFVTDRWGKVVFVNPRGAQIMGLKASEMKGRMIQELVNEGIISRSGSLAVLEQKKKVDILQFLKEGSKWRLCTGVPVYNSQKELILTLCTSKDMTELVEIKKELEDKVDELKRKDSELNNMQEELFAQVNFISKSPQMHKIKEEIKKIAPLDLTVLIQGETGVGKEVVARAIHALSPRRQAPFIKISCSAFPESLISSELFGYEGGAFTGADSKGRKGKIELAEGGTLFLDEIGEISPDLQVKLLEFLQDMEIFRIGGTKKIRVDTRVIAATNRNLQKEVSDGNFRRDLYYRLNLIPIMIPPLRVRQEDIPALINYYLDLYNRKHNKNVAFDEQVIEEFVHYQWPGNVRELEHVLERAVVMHSNGLGSSRSFAQKLIGFNNDREGVSCSEIIPYKEAKQQLERELVEKAYSVYGSTYKAAEALGIAQSTVVRILKRIRQRYN
ncbi:MAG: sigma 54-interacting transcriptional regulator [Bacillota bacterium]|nr:sigma 54-interacting transcriptional regulator [Bacillota bacterium]